ncbi:hypothetical protein BH09MYX1_BH09MYX1_21960 [soil metagenome]
MGTVRSLRACRSKGLALAAIIALTCFASAAHAEGAPNAERLKSAAVEYDAGRRAYTENKFEDAASHFENAYHDAPNAQTIRYAIVCRSKANQLARAATLAVLAFSKYPDDEQVAQVVKQTLADAEPKLFKLAIACTPECGVASDGRVLSVEDAKKVVFFLDPGAHAVVVSWEGDRTKQLDVNGKAGASQDFTLEAPPMPVKVASPAGPATGADQPPPSGKPFGPGVFFVGLGLTAVAGGVLAWSGIDTINNPGADAVKQKCVGLGETCPEYQDGRAKQLRTNVLIGVTAGLGALTLITGIFLTQWSSPKKASAAFIRPYFDLGTSSSVGVYGAF